MTVPRTDVVPAEADLIIIGPHGAIGFGTFLATAWEAELVRRGAIAYAHCLRALPIPRGQATVRTNLSKFADLIEAEPAYWCTNPDGREIVSTLRVLHERMVSAEAAGQQIVVPAGKGGCS